MCMNIDYYSRPGTDLNVLDPYGAIAMLAEVVECKANCYLMSALMRIRPKECFVELFSNRSALNLFVTRYGFLWRGLH